MQLFFLIFVLNIFEKNSEISSVAVTPGPFPNPISSKVEFSFFSGSQVEMYSRFSNVLCHEPATTRYVDTYSPETL
jgi:hypothetical protein